MHYENADSLYKKSLNLFRGASPIHYAWLEVQYGIHKLEILKFKSAKQHFLQALKKAPDYVLGFRAFRRNKYNFK